MENQLSPMSYWEREKNRLIQLIISGIKSFRLRFNKPGIVRQLSQPEIVTVDSRWLDQMLTNF